MKKVTDIEIIEGLHVGDGIIFEIIFKRYWRRIVYYISGKVFDKDVAEDIAQEAFTKLYDYRKKIDCIKHINNFLYLVSYRKVLIYIRDNKRRFETEKCFYDFNGIIELDDSLKKEIELNELTINILEEIEKMRQRQKVAMMAYFVGCNTTMTANKLNITVNNLYILQSRGFKILREKFKRA